MLLIQQGDAMGAKISRPNKHITSTRELKDVNLCFKQGSHVNTCWDGLEDSNLSSHRTAIQVEPNFCL